ncbi:MAG: ATP-binding protein [Ruminobacter sp.]|uniref:ATP-binding protein n=1 Tax=Ruminobacter sp. TaxID=2774296 RepID=UPI001B5B7D97|nr:ATP-binding protein [Ruminobacter sp.]MBP3749480.1 ATP-binding protein [Ruminobacter sp.]
MKKGDVLDLIKYHFQNREKEFKDKTITIAREFDKTGDSQLAQYVMGILSQANTFFPQSEDAASSLIPVKLDTDPLPLPEPIMNDLKGIINAVNHGIGVNKFLFIGSPGTGKTESSKHIARLLGRRLLQVDFSNLVDSKLGQTAKNLTSLFSEINGLPFPNKNIILFDEIDTIALDRINQNDVREMGRVTSTFLKSLDAVASEIVIIATTNLFANLDKALVRRFDATIDFDRYTVTDKIDVAEVILNNYVRQFKNVARDLRLFKKILKNAKHVPNPGELKNIIRTSLAFSDEKDPYDYLKRFFSAMFGRKLPTLKELHSLGFTVREIEILTGISKSSVSRGLNGGEYE